MMRSMSASGIEDFYWKSNSEWYYYDFQKKRIVMTDKAPDDALDSFENWKKKYKFNS